MENPSTTTKIGCKIQSRSLLVQKQDTHYSFDRTGRLLFLTQPGRAIRRGLDHRMVESVQSPNQPQQRMYHDLTEDEKGTILRDAYEAVRTCLEEVATLPRPSDGESYKRESVLQERAWLTRVLSWQKRDLQTDANAFRQTYLPISILPPDQYHSLVIQVTEGCSYNRCLFCDFYRHRPFKIKSDTELAIHLAKIQAFFGERLLDMDEVFLGDGNALVVPTQRLLSMIGMIRSTLGERFPSISTFVDTFTLEKKTESDLALLHQSGLNTAYIGFETGFDELRRLLQKPGSANEAAEAVRLLKAAGWRVAIILLMNLGSREMAARHLEETIRSLTPLQLTKSDLIYLSPFVEPSNSPYLTAAPRLRQQLIRETNHDVNTEFQLWKTRILSVHGDVKVSLYPIRQHLY